MGRSRGGPSSKIHMVCDALGQPMRFVHTRGQAADAPQVIPLLTGIETAYLIADKGYESNKILAFIRSKDETAVTPPKSIRKPPRGYDLELYRQRNLVERAFNKLKHWCRVATRYDRRSVYFLSGLYLVASVIWG